MSQILLSKPQLEEVCKILAEYTTGTRITNMLADLRMYDMDTNKSSCIGSSTKWTRIANAVIEYQNTHNSNLGLQRIIEYILTPANFINKADKNWFEATTAVNRILQFNGLEINDSGKVIATVKTKK